MPFSILSGNKIHLYKTKKCRASAYWKFLKMPMKEIKIQINEESSYVFNNIIYTFKVMNKIVIKFFCIYID